MVPVDLRLGVDVPVAHAPVPCWAAAARLAAFVCDDLLFGDAGPELARLGIGTGTTRPVAEPVLAPRTGAVRIGRRRLAPMHHISLRLPGVGSPVSVAAGTLAAARLPDRGFRPAVPLAVIIAPKDAASNRVRPALDAKGGPDDGPTLPRNGASAHGDGGRWPRSGRRRASPQAMYLRLASDAPMSKPVNGLP